MSKKWFYGILASVVAGALLTGCGKQDEPSGRPDKGGKPAGAEKGKSPKASKKTETKGKPAAGQKKTEKTVAAPQADEAEYSADGKTLLKYKGKGTEFTVRDGVATIGDGAFAGCETIETVKLPDSVTAIGSRAFAECRNLNAVNLPSGVTTIGGNAFEACNLKSVAIPAGVTTIGERAFAGCTGLATVEPPSREASIGQGAFNDCPCEAYVKERCPSYKR